MTTSKIKIKLGAIEIEYEGSDDFLKEELPLLLSTVSDLYAKSHVLPSTPELKDVEGDTVNVITNNSSKPKLEATTGSIAAKLACKTGSDLVMAAAARLTLVLHSPTFSRQRIIDEMKTASAYYRATYVNNLSRSLNALVKEGKLNEPSRGNYALTVVSLREMEQRLV